MSSDTDDQTTQELTVEERFVFLFFVFLRFMYLLLLLEVPLPWPVKLPFFALWGVGLARDILKRKKVTQDALKPVSPWWLLVSVGGFGLFLWFCVIRPNLH